MSNRYNSLLVAELHQATNSETWTVEKNAALYPAVQAGDGSSRETMIKGNMPLVVAKVESFIRCVPTVAYLRDDLVSAAFTGLVKAVNKMAEGKGPRSTTVAAPTDFIGMWIGRELRRLVEKEHFIHVPETSKRRARKEGEEVVAPTVANVIPERFENASYEAKLEMRDLIDACCLTEAERTFFAMREASHTFAEIAAVLGVPVYTVSNVARKLRARVRATIARDGQLPVERKP